MSFPMPFFIPEKKILTYTYNGFAYTDVYPSFVANINVTNVPFGTASADRLVVCMITFDDSSGGDSYHYTNITIAGITATVTYSRATYFAYANVPTGTSGTVATTWNAAQLQGAYINTFSLYNYNSATPYYSNSASSLTYQVSLSSFQVPAHGLGLFLETTGGESGTTFGLHGALTWTTATEVYEGDWAGGDSRRGLAKYDNTAINSNYTGTITAANSPVYSFDRELVGVSWV